MLNTGDPFGGDMKTCSYSAAFMAENADALVPQGLTETALSGAQAKGQLGVAFAKVAKGEIKPGSKIAVGTKPNGDEFSLIYKGFQGGQSSVTPAKLTKILEEAGFKKSHTTKAQDTHTGQLYGGGTKDTKGFKVKKSLSNDGSYDVQTKSMDPTEKASVKAALQDAGFSVNDHGLSAFKVNPGGAGAGHTYEVLKKGKYGEKSYNAKEDSAFLQQLMDEAQWKFGNASKPTVSAGPPTAKTSVGAMSDEDVSTLFVVIKDELAKQKGINIKGANPELDALVHADIGARIGYTAQEVAAKIEAYKATGKKLSALKKKALKSKPTIPKKPKPATKPDDLETIEDLLKPVGSTDPYPLAQDYKVKSLKDMLFVGEPEEILYVKDLAANASGKVEAWIQQSAQKALKQSNHTWTDQPNGVPTQATTEVVKEVMEDLDDHGLMHKAYTDEDKAAAYIMAKDKVVADSNGKWTLYTKSDEMEDAIYSMIKEVTGLASNDVKTGVQGYLAAGKKLSVLKKQLIKQGSMKKAAPTLKGGTKATKANVDAFANKGFEPKGHVAAKLTEKQEGNLYQSFKTNGHPNYLTSPESDLVNNMLQIQKGFAKEPHNLDLSLLDIVRAIDKAGAKKFGVDNEFLFEKKIVSWTASPEGKAYLQAKMDAEKLLANMPDLPADSKAFNVLSTQEARAMQDRLPAWSSSESSGLRHYTGGAYSDMNRYLRGKTTYISPTDKRAIENAKSGMRAVDQSFLVRRGCSFAQFEVGSHEELMAMVGKTVRDKGFLSTSVGGESAFSGTVKMEVEVVKGTRGAYVDHISKHRGEREFIIDPGTKMKILRVDAVGYQTVVRLRVVL